MNRMICLRGSFRVLLLDTETANNAQVVLKSTTLEEVCFASKRVLVQLPAL
jgi:hypothetical protein